GLRLDHPQPGRTRDTRRANRAVRRQLPAPDGAASARVVGGSRCRASGVPGRRLRGIAGPRLARSHVIGIPLLLGAGLAIGSTVLAIDARPGRRVVISTAVAAVLAVALLAAGFEFSWNHLVCPPTGDS